MGLVCVLSRETKKKDEKKKVSAEAQQCSPATEGVKQARQMPFQDPRIIPTNKNPSTNEMQSDTVWQCPQLPLCTLSKRGPTHTASSINPSNHKARQ